MKPESRYHFLVISLICVFLFLSRFSYADPLDNWHVRGNPVPGITLNAITYGNGMFVTVGDAGTILTSPDGMTWTQRVSGTIIDLHGAAYDNGIFVTVGGSSDPFSHLKSSVILTSPDGLNWTVRDLGTTEGLMAVTYGNGVFVAVGNNGNFMISPDGVTWTAGNSGFFSSLGITYGNDIFVVVGYGPIITSLDGLKWAQSSTPFSPNLLGIGYGKGTFVTVGVSKSEFYGIPDDAEMFTSADGASWTYRYYGSKEILQGVTYGKDMFVAVGDNGTLLTSSDGANWSAKISGTTTRLDNAAYGNNTFVVVGESGTILQSDPLSGNCTATLSSDLNLHIPVINFNGSYIGGDAACETAAGGSMVCRVTNYRKVNPQDFADCQPSTLTQDLKLHVPAGIYNNISYEVDFEHAPTNDNQIWFKLTRAAKD